MTRALLTSMLIALCAAQAGAQVTLTSDDMWGLGDWYYARANPEDVNVSVEGVILPPGEQHWDFRDIFDTNNSRELIYDYVPTTDGGFGAENIFPGAAFAERLISDPIRDRAGTAWMYLKQTPGVGRTNYGTYTPFDPALAEPETVFQPPIVDFPDPLQYLQTWIVTMEYFQTQDVSGQLVDVHVYYTSECEVDGWGTVRLPNLGTLNCLRVNEEATFDVYAIWSGSEIPAGTVKIRNYYWIAEDSGIVVHIQSPQSSGAMPVEEFSVAAFFQIMTENSNPVIAPQIEALTDETVLAVDQLYTRTVTSSGAPDPTFSLLNPPAGMTIDAETGVIEWTPTGAQAGVHPIDVHVENIAGSDDAGYKLTVVNANEAPLDLMAPIVSAGGVALSWSPPVSTPLLAGYHVYRADALAGPFVLVDSVPAGQTTYTDTSAAGGATSYYQVTAALEIAPQAWESVPSNTAAAYVLAAGESAYSHDDGTAESSLVVGGQNAEKAISFELGTTDEVRLTKVAVYLASLNGVSLTVKFYAGDNGFRPGSSLGQLTYPASMLTEGWNVLAVQPEFLQPVFTGGGVFFVGIVEGSTENPVGIDTGTSGNSWSKTPGGDWTFLFGGELMIRAILEGEWVAGDMNCDGVLDVFDINPFVEAIVDPAGYAASYPGCDIGHGDMNGDLAVDVFDINPFVDALLN